MKDTPAWRALTAHRDALARQRIEALWRQDPRRGDDFTFPCGGIAVDFSKQKITRETLKLLMDLARARGVPHAIERLFAGERVNASEKRPALHMALRGDEHVSVDGTDVMPEIERNRDRIRVFTNAVRAGQWKGATGLKITHVVAIGIGGSALGPQLAIEALHDRANGPATLSTAQPPRRGADATLEFMADHAAATADRAFHHWAVDRVFQGFSHMRGLDVKTVDVVEQAVKGFQYHRHVPVETTVVRLLLAIKGNQGIAHHAEAVGIGEGNRAGQQTGLANPFKPGGVTVAVEHMHAGKTWLLIGRTGARFDQRDAGADIPPGAAAPAHIAVADAHAGHIGNGVERAGR